jgi:oxygen-dependent protoporphyrinogen oxidase
VLDRLVEPALGGIYAGRPDQLSAPHALSGLYALEREHGSVLRGLWRRRGARPPTPRRSIASFAEGLETIPRRLVAALEELGGGVRYGTRVTALRPTPTGWLVQPRAAEEGPYDGVVFAGPAHALSGLELPCAAADALRRAASVPYAPVAVLSLGFRRDAVEHPLDGFGMLVPAVERRAVLGAIFSSSLFAERAPRDHVLLTVFLGGARDPRLVEAAPEHLLARALEDLRTLLGVRGEPAFRRHTVWPRAIPQYVVGHGEVLAALDEVERTCPGLVLAGNYRGGVAVGDALASGCAAAERLLRRLVSHA